MSPMMSTKKRKLTLKKPQPDPIPQPEDEVEQEQVEYEEEEQEDDDNDDVNDDEDSDEEPITKLLEPFSKDQLMSLLVSAAESHPDIASNIRTLADEDPVHRKIFIHGLGWDATTETLKEVFGKYGEIEDCKAVMDKATGKSKGYGFVMFRSRSGARRALREPQKRIGNRMTACQLAAVGPVPGGTGQAIGGSEHSVRKIYVSNVSPEIDPGKLTGYFAKYGEIEEGPLGIDKATGKFKGFCLFVYKTVEGAKRALEEAHKNFEGHMLHCQQAIDGLKMGKQQQQFQQRNGQFGGRNDNVGIGGGSVVNGGHFMGNPALAAQAALNPVLGQALTALLASQGAGFGLGNIMGIGPGVNPAGVYGNQGVGTSGVLGGYGVQPGLQAAYPNQQLGQGSTGGRSGQGSGHLSGSSGPYSGH
ncbi:hypothetical protein Drorol1_Dr00015305 [Drosera rotundifolia]